MGTNSGRSFESIKVGCRNRVLGAVSSAALGAGLGLIPVGGAWADCSPAGDLTAQAITCDGTGADNTPFDAGAGADTIDILSGSFGGSISGGDDDDFITVTGGTVGGDILGAAGADTVVLSEGVPLANIGNILGGANLLGDDLIRIEVADSATRSLNEGRITEFEDILVRNDTDPDARSTLTLNSTTGAYVLDAGDAGGGVPAIGSTFRAAGNVTIDFANTSGDNMIRAETITFEDGTTLTGTGTVRGNTTIEGVHAPGNSPGLMTFAGSLTYNSTAVLQIEFTDDDSSGDIENTLANRGVEFDAVDVGGSLAVTAGATMIVDFIDVGGAAGIAGLAEGDEFDIFRIAGALAAPSDFSLIVLPNSHVSGLRWEFFTELDGPTTVYGLRLAEDVPEPGTLASLGLGVLSLFGLRRNLKRKQSRMKS